MSPTLQDNTIHTLHDNTLHTQLKPYMSPTLHENTSYTLPNLLVSHPENTIYILHYMSHTLKTRLEP